MQNVCIEASFFTNIWFGIFYLERILPEAFVVGCDSFANLTQPYSLLSVSGGSFPTRAGTPFHSHGRFVTQAKKKKVPQMMCFRDLPLRIKIKHRLFHLARFQFEKLGWISTE